ncbi:MAG: hypothetical protein EZS26_003770 [Candidatus Ordinivivax streblomastigis]|uniref:PEGA domain-containing protein n=1 Tax=Candidatus Ordinivivax streblomastigis TaxID=2540710 RepID=A0A5M8NUU9_9BACT|nr:MAG: hypothetical protein EZS26_003770 [Candidatus Ordinivivax streblomastigis]
MIMKKVFSFLLGIIMLTSCATIICGTRQSVDFTSNPSNAIIYDNGFQLGKTPLSAKLERKENHAISIKLEGYQPYEVIIKKQFNEWYIGNIILGGLVGLIIDPLTGALYRLSPDKINTELNLTTFNHKKTDIYVAVSLIKNPYMEQIGTLVRE